MVHGGLRNSGFAALHSALAVALFGALGDVTRVMAAILQNHYVLAVQDARNDRKRRQEMAEQWDQKVTQLSAAQLVTEEKLQGLIETMRQSNNGHS